MRRGRGTIAALAVAGLAITGVIALAGAADRQGENPGPVFQLHPGAIEIGLAGSLVAVEGSTRANLGFGAGSFLALGSGLAGYGAEVSYQHVQSLDLLGLEGVLSWQRALGGTSAYPYVAVAGGLRQEWLGSFRQARYPIGPTLGLRVLAGDRAAVRIEYRFRRVLNDPVADFSEHQLLAGVSLLFRNRRDQEAE